VAPEAMAGGPLGAVKDGDWIELDCVSNKLQLDISDEEMKARLAERAAQQEPPKSGYQQLYIDHVLQAIRHLGPDIHVMAVCQPAPLVLAAIALLAEDDDADRNADGRQQIDDHLGGGAELARTHLLYGEWLRRNRRGTEARPVLRTALTLFDRSGAAPWADRARAELRAAGEAVAPEAPARDRLSLLTPQELQIVRLVGQGMSNRQVAGQVFLSPRTVEWHLRKVFVKLGISSRRQLRAALPGLGSAGR